jgi:purine-binding chemotaxis protein CheW
MQPSNETIGQFEQVVVLHVKSGEYAVPIQRVQEIVRVPAITRVPRTAGDVEGVINLRGHVLPVVDLAARLGLGSAVRDKQSRVVVVQRATDSVGLLVDGVSEVLRLTSEDIEPRNDLGEPATEANPVLGVAKLPEHLILLLDLDTVLN